MSPTLEEVKDKIKQAREHITIARLQPKSKEQLTIKKEEPVICFTPEQLERARYTLGISDYLIWIFAVFFLTTPLWIPNFTVGYAFGFALLSTLLVRALEIRAITILFTVIYYLLSMLFGFIFSIWDIITIVFLFNTISLFSLIVGMVVFISTISIGTFMGIKRKSKYAERIKHAPLIIIILALFLATGDVVITLGSLGITSIWTFLIYLVSYYAMYMVSFLLTWAIVFLSFSALDEMLKKATEAERKMLENIG